MIGRLWMRAVLVAVAVGLWVLAAWPAVASAQTTVRQAKLVTTDANGNPLINDLRVQTYRSGRSFDTTAFASAVLTITGVSGCGAVFANRPTWEVPGVFGWIRPGLIYGGIAGLLQVTIDSAPAQSGTFSEIIVPNAVVSFFDVPADCVIDLSMLLVPFSTTVSTTGPAPIATRVDTLWTNPLIIGGMDTPQSGSYANVYGASVNSAGALLVRGTSAPPVLATEDPIVPNSITTTETVYSFDGTKRLTLQANGTGYVWCRVTSDNTLVITSSNYTIALAAASIADNGTGGSITLPYIPASGTYLRCIAGTGTAIVNGFAHP